MPTDRHAGLLTLEKRIDWSVAASVLAERQRGDPVSMLEERNDYEEVEFNTDTGEHGG